MKYVIYLSFFFTFWSFAQGELNPEWMIKRTSPTPNGNAEAWAIGVDDNGDIYWGVNQDMPGWFIWMDATLYKFDSDTNEIWFKHAVSDTYAQQSYHLQLSDTSVFVGGRTCHSAGVTNCEALYYDINKASGNTNYISTWTQGYGYEEIDGIHFEPDGIILTGWTRGDTTAMDMLIMKVDYSGNEIWSNTWGSEQPNRDEHQDGHIAVDDSMIYVTGIWKGSPGLGFEGNAIVAKFNKSNGQFVDSVLFGLNSIWVNAENGLGLTQKDEFIYATGVSTTSENNWDIFIVKYDKNLNQIWHTTFGGNAGESARSIYVNENDEVFVVGNTESYGNDSMNVLFLKLQPNGTVDWFKTWGGNQEDQTLDFFVHENNFYITGKTKSFHPNSLWEAFLLKVNPDSIATVNSNTLSYNVDVYPTLFNNSIKIDYKSETEYEIDLFDLQGKSLFHSTHNKGTKEIYLDFLLRGTYLLQLKNEEGYVYHKKVIKH